MHTKNYETTSEKADRLKNSFRVILTGFDQALVIGDHDTYTVDRVGHRWRCSCPWGQSRRSSSPCSHIKAVRLARKDPSSQLPVARLADLLIEAQQKVGVLR